MSVPLGFLIVAPPRAALCPNSIARTSYCGVDRLPYIEPPDAEIRNALGLPPVTDPTIYMALDRWYQLLVDKQTPIIPSFASAMELLQSLHRVDRPLELLYCELESDTCRWPHESGSAPQAERPPSSYLLGYDVSNQWCKYSLLYQPWANRADFSELPSCNASGLCDSAEDAVRVRDAYEMGCDQIEGDMFVFRLFSVPRAT
jgi:hypothetical protein